MTISDAEPGRHGVHVHEFGDLSDQERGTACGPHYNPYGEEHGCWPGPRKAGDMGNVVVDDRGEGQYEEVANFLMRLRGEASILGRSAIFHAQEDTCERTPAGDASAGARVGQCIVGLVAPTDAVRARAWAAFRRHNATVQ